MPIDSLHQIAWSPKRVIADLDDTDAATLVHTLKEAMLTADWSLVEYTWPIATQPIGFGVPVVTPPDPPMDEDDKTTVDSTGAFIGAWDYDEDVGGKHWTFFHFYDAYVTKPGTCSQPGFEGNNYWVEIGTTAVESLFNLAAAITLRSPFIGSWFIEGVGLGSQHIVFERKHQGTHAALYNLDNLYTDSGTVGLAARFSGGGYVLQSGAPATNRSYQWWLRGTNAGGDLQAWCQVRSLDDNDVVDGSVEFPMGEAGRAFSNRAVINPYQCFAFRNADASGCKLFTSAPQIKAGIGVTRALFATNTFRDRMHWSTGASAYARTAAGVNGPIVAITDPSPAKRTGIVMLRFMSGPLLGMDGKAQICNAWVDLTTAYGDPPTTPDSKTGFLLWDMLAATDKADYGTVGAFDGKEFTIVIRQETDTYHEVGGDASAWMATGNDGGEDTWTSPGRSTNSAAYTGVAL